MALLAGYGIYKLSKFIKNRRRSSISNIVEYQTNIGEALETCLEVIPRENYYYIPKSYKIKNTKVSIRIKVGTIINSFSNVFVYVSYSV